MNLNLKKMKSGFTLIELLVVIAIIGILAALVLVALGNARSKATDSKIKSDIGQLRVLAEVVYDSSNSSYATVATCFGAAPTLASCGNDTPTLNSVTTLIADIKSVNGNVQPAVQSTTTAFCVSSPTTVSGIQCTDSTGKTSANACALVATVPSC